MRPPKRTRVQHISHSQAVTTPSECSRKVTIRSVSEEVLLNVFRYYLDAFPRFWPSLVHVCRKWRQIVFASHHALHLRLFCTHGTPVLKTIDCFPALPIVVHYGGTPALDPPSPNDEDNIMAAMKHSGRVISISLTVTSSLLEKLSAIERPFAELDDLVLLSQGSVPLTLPNNFRWGERLRTLHLTRPAIPALPELLSPSTGLVDLQIHKIPDVGYFSPEVFVNTLSRMTQLRTLSLHFLSFTPHRNTLGLPLPSEERVILSALTCLTYRGTSMYLEGLVARIDAPRLGDIDITFFCRDKMAAPQLDRFINRIEMQKSHCRAEIISSDRAITISFTQPEAPTRLELQVSGKTLNRSLSSMAKICNSLSVFLLGMEPLRINSTRPSSGQDYGDREEWLKLINPFRGTKWVHVAVDQSTNIVLPLNLRQAEAVLPTLQPRCALLRENVASFIHSRQLSGHIIGAEYERVRINELSGSCGTGPFSQQVTIEMIPDDVLLSIFRFYLDSSPQFWPALTHVTRRWRHIVFTSPLGLDLRLFCTYGTPVSKLLDFWPALPIVVQYGGETVLDPPAPEDEDNIVAALKHSDRVSSIGLTITSSLLKKLSNIEMPFSELEKLVIRSTASMQLALPCTPRWGARLRTLHSTRIAFPALPELLSPSTGLVDIQLHEIPNVGYFSPEAFANALSEMTQLERLSLHFLPFPSRRNHLALPPQSGERVVLPALTFLKYRGISKYLDSLVARIDAPRLGDIDITFFSKPTMDASQLGRFMDRIEKLTSLRQAEIEFSELATSISFVQPGGPTQLKLRISCQQLDWQLSSMAQICEQFSPLTFRVKDLRIKEIQQPSGQGASGIDHEQWLKLIRPFRGAKNLYVDDRLVSEIFFDFGLANGKNPGVFPSLRILRVLEVGTMPYGFSNSRPQERRYVDASVYGTQCKICRASFTEPHELKKHLVVLHAYRLACPYCGDFEFAPRYSDLFREHLTRKHPEVAHKDTLILNSALSSPSPSHSGGQVAQSNDLRASVNFGAFTMFNAPNDPWPESPTYVQPRLNTVVRFLTSRYPTWLSEDI